LLTIDVRLVPSISLFKSQTTILSADRRLGVCLFADVLGSSTVSSRPRALASKRENSKTWICWPLVLVC